MVMALLLHLGSEFSWIEIGYEDTLTRGTPCRYIIGMRERYISGIGGVEESYACPAFA